MRTEHFTLTRGMIQVRLFGIGLALYFKRANWITLVGPGYWAKGPIEVSCEKRMK